MVSESKDKHQRKDTVLVGHSYLDITKNIYNNCLDHVIVKHGKQENTYELLNYITNHNLKNNYPAGTILRILDEVR